MNGAYISFFGRLTRDPGEIRYGANNGTAYIRAGVAVNTFRYGEQEPVATFYNVTFWGRHAENVMNRCRQGSEIYVQGNYLFREYTRQDGSKGYSHDVSAREVEFRSFGEQRSQAEDQQEEGETTEPRREPQAEGKEDQPETETETEKETQTAAVAVATAPSGTVDDDMEEERDPFRNDENQEEEDPFA